MTAAQHALLHGLGVLKAATAADLARRTGQQPAAVVAALAAAETSGRVVCAGDRWTLAPLARLALQADYSRVHAAVRADTAFVAANADFEVINRDLKALITDWQTVTLAGQRLANDHRDAAYDARIIDRLGRLHDRASPVLQRLAARVPALAFYAPALLAAVERAEDGDAEWVSDTDCESYHTLWFELHEELIRILGGARSE